MVMKMSHPLNNDNTNSSMLFAEMAAFLRISVAIALLCVGVGGEFMFAIK